MLGAEAAADGVIGTSLRGRGHGCVIPFRFLPDVQKTLNSLWILGRLVVDYGKARCGLREAFIFMNSHARCSVESLEERFSRAARVRLSAGAGADCEMHKVANTYYLAHSSCSQ